MKGKNNNSVKVIFEDDRYNYWTSVSAETTKESAADYFVGKALNLGQTEDNIQTVTAIDFIDRNPKLSTNDEAKVLEWCAYTLGCKNATFETHRIQTNRIDKLAKKYNTDSQTLFDYFSPDEKAAAVRAIYG